MARQKSRAITVVDDGRPSRLAAWGLLPGWHSLVTGGARGGARDLLVLEAERRRAFLWLPVAFGCGIILYFLADAEPSLWPSAIGTGVAALVAAVTGRHRRLAGVAIAVAAVMAGFAAATWRTRSVAAPVLVRPMIAKLGGLVLSVEERPAGPRIVVRVASLGSLTANDRPAQVRVSLRPGASVKAGDFIEATARLLPPPTAARPGGYDFARDAFFAELGAVGSLVGKVTVRAPPEAPDIWTALTIANDVARNTLTERIAKASGGQEGALAAALVTGKRGLITEEVNDALRAAGIYHIVSISGLHMALAAGSLFWAARALLSLWPAIALAWPVKKMAAVIGMLGATAYCLFSGAEVATQRSLVMTIVMMGAILIDRPALSMRNLALSALICLALRPEALLGPSFQMSFAAVAGMIAFTVRPSGLLAGGAPSSDAYGWMRAAGRWAFLLTTTTTVATIATAPFSAYHFQTLNPFGLLGNAMALPLIELAVMPLSVLGVFASFFELDRPVWWLIGQATVPVLASARAVAELERSRVIVPAFDVGALGVMVIAILWVTLWTTALRWLALLPAVIGLVMAHGTSRPDIYIDRGASGLALRVSDGRLVILGKPSGFVLEQWLRADGDGRAIEDPSLRHGTLCDPLGCTARLKSGQVIAFVRDKRAFPEDCKRAAVIVSPLPATRTCEAGTIIDRRVLDRSGAIMLTLDPRDAAFNRTQALSTASRPWITGVKPPQPSARPSDEKTSTVKAPASRRQSLDPIDAMPDGLPEGEEREPLNSDVED
ncbi:MULTISPECIES: ComEC/Rec2 family competence protein [unclassified Chelatococcus]|uniref:ComEC/Rec2 family competence protein n=1 Tax=unclassified Chelatococcus TaxID=2638111 RepID=UPI001BCBB62A|nr:MULTISPECIES: ComEC/Rec2 family competence protein [unclassified Chelatococcus]CAH1673057.1 Competence protein ComEC [Hyphomicrobiales bacterium]MBS7738669.1 ComEC/Rec2 family competence protein [Chelatococcus sp. HY11]MBX3543073.1 ComEC/Rec2 family competence protein [Chelatococcus sp.]MCO5076801.1 ComEC family competence protein [Chelatococcus sp.]CAH1674698.1 Competence protein ComEC [Hyphomicrobiales bacterium]